MNSKVLKAFLFIFVLLITFLGLAYVFELMPKENLTEAAQKLFMAWLVLFISTLVIKMISGKSPAELPEEEPKAR